jgi:hypothetical protein
MTSPCTGTNISEWLTYLSDAATARNVVPPRDPDDDEDEDEGDEDRNEDLDPAVIREPEE